MSQTATKQDRHAEKTAELVALLGEDQAASIIARAEFETKTLEEAGVKFKNVKPRGAVAASTKVIPKVTATPTAAEKAEAEKMDCMASGATSFAALELERELSDLSAAFSAISQNVMSLPDLTPGERATLITAAASDFEARIGKGKAAPATKGRESPGRPYADMLLQAARQVAHDDAEEAEAARVKSERDQLAELSAGVEPMARWSAPYVLDVARRNAPETGERGKAIKDVEEAKGPASGHVADALALMGRLGF